MSLSYFLTCARALVRRIQDSFGTTMFHLASGQGWCLPGLANAGRGDSWKRWSSGQTGHHLDTHTEHTKVIHGSKPVLRLTSSYTLTLIKLGIKPIRILIKYIYYLHIFPTK